jgi:hypothetical protein
MEIRSEIDFFSFGKDLHETEDWFVVVKLMLFCLKLPDELKLLIGLQKSGRSEIYLNNCFNHATISCEPFGKYTGQILQIRSVR